MEVQKKSFLFASVKDFNYECLRSEYAELFIKNKYLD